MGQRTHDDSERNADMVDAIREMLGKRPLSHNPRETETERFAGRSYSLDNSGGRTARKGGC